MTTSDRLGDALSKLANLREELRHQRDSLAKTEKLLKAVPGTAADCLAHEARARRALEAVAASDHTEAGACARSALDALSGTLSRVRESFLRDFREEARQRSIRADFRDSFFLVNRLRLVPDLGAGRCRIDLGDEVVEQGLPLDASKCLAALERHSDRLFGSRRDPEKILKILFEAYRAVCGQRGSKSGETVPIVDLLPQVAVLNQGPKFRRDPTRGNYRAYGRAEFAADVFLLKAARRLEVSGHRLNLQTAVIDTSGDRSRSISVPNEAGESMVYYQGLAFVLLERGGRK